MKEYAVRMTIAQFLFRSALFSIREVLKHLTMTPSHLHPANSAYVKVYQLWCEYLKRKSYVIFFFHLFKYRRGHVAQAQSKRLISLELTMCGFEPLRGIQTFQY